ncbi:putative transposase/invertase (TIGR01784 family) [Halanaerobium sp. DL-01]|uniref:Rpn family recombination-promoting nuclease/putative transposase n=1 Tax=Halanaerobium sp. DL-01 TaxID=1653064 RepID=UPI000DF35B60|nr:Rpn family recombination-promoting nuclease/putative transposase [Halanaerobium sp. DL-01]RCW86935.1 putative transposase/invertase (TIGR01784 family) [Halanaerobium sp. DL-01]
MISPHDKFFKEMFSKKEVAESFIKSYLPKELLEIMDSSHLEISKDSFVDKKLKEYFSVGLRYILEIVDYDVDIMKQKVDTIIPERSEAFMSTANKLREEGIEKGKKEELIETIIGLTAQKLNIEDFPSVLEKKLNNSQLETLKTIRNNILNIESLKDLEGYLN